jgi:hypothetical protein
LPADEIAKQKGKTMTLTAYRKQSETLVQIEDINAGLTPALKALMDRQMHALWREVKRQGWELVALSFSSEYGGAGWCMSRHWLQCSNGRDYVTHSWSVNDQGQVALVSGHHDLSVVGAYKSLQERTL